MLPEPEFHFGDVYKYLLEKVERKETCCWCDEAFNYGDQVKQMACGHLVHERHGSTWVCNRKKEHKVDSRYSIGIKIRHDSNVPKKKRGRSRTKESAYPTFGVSRIPIAEMRRLLGTGESSSQEVQHRMSGHKCNACETSLRADRAIYRHQTCGNVLCATCIGGNPELCCICGEALDRDVERLDYTT